jgi:sec-independent protein translocase protein TatA
MAGSLPLAPSRERDKTVNPAVFQSIGPTELIIVLVIVLVIFGPKRLPDLGRSLGRGLREFKDSVTGKDKEREELEAAEEAGEQRERPCRGSGVASRRVGARGEREGRRIAAGVFGTGARDAAR